MTPFQGCVARSSHIRRALPCAVTGRPPRKLKHTVNKGASRAGLRQAGIYAMLQHPPSLSAEADGHCSLFIILCSFPEGGAFPVRGNGVRPSINSINSINYSNSSNSINSSNYL